MFRAKKQIPEDLPKLEDRFCPTCRRPLSPRATKCPGCGEVLDDAWRAKAALSEPLWAEINALPEKARIAAEKKQMREIRLIGWGAVLFFVLLSFVSIFSAL